MPESKHNFGSFDYKITNPEIRKILKARSVLDNTIQVAMPFVKATTTIQIPEYLGAGNIGFTIGLHAINSDVRAEDMLSNAGGTAPYVGYTYTGDGTNQKIYAQYPADNLLAKFFEDNIQLATSAEGKDFLRIPPPGITKMTIGRNKNGLLASGQLEISVPSLAQLEILHRTFFIPGVGMVLEWGQQFAAELSPSFGERGDISEHLFPWYDRGRLTSLLDRLAKREVGLEEILNCYVYPTQGQYMWMFGRVANFSTKANSDGSFDCSVKIVGPSEDAWAYSTKQTVVPPKDNSGQICAEGANSVESFFTKTVGGGLNLKSLLDGVYKGELLPEWKDHVEYFQNGNKKEGEPGADTQKPNTSEKSFAESDDAYFMTWRFFVNVVINHPEHGVKAIFEKAGLPESTKQKIALIRPYLDGPARSSAPTAINSPGGENIDDPLENYIGFNQFLRSVDPGTMIVVNEAAAVLASQDNSPNRADPEVRKLLNETDKSKEFAKIGKLETSTNAAGDTVPANSRDRAFLSTGVWLNHKAVAESMAGADTVLRGVATLLDRMNSATRGFWALTLDVAEPQTYTCPTVGTSTDFGTAKYEYTIIDANYRPNSVAAVERLKNNIHIFNKYIRKIPRDGGGVELVGSELTDCTVDLALPKRLFSQIATMGLVQPKDLQAAGGEVQANTDTNCSTALISDANDSLREMFAITTLSPSANGGQGPDLTIKPIIPSPTGTCGQNNTQVTAQAAGIGNQPGPANASSAGQPPANNANAAEKAAAQSTVESEECKKCQQCNPTSTPSAAGVVSIPGSTQEFVVYDSVQGPFNVPISYTNRSTRLAAASQLYDAGFRNGRMPASAMVTINKYAACGSAKTFPEAADALIRMLDAAWAAGHKIKYCEGYRPIGVQINCIKDKGWTGGPAHVRSPTQLKSRRTGNYIGLCAQPGTSNHGWALAFDLSTEGGGSISNGSPAHNWLKANASNYQFTQDPAEAWHWEFNGRVTFSGTPPTNPAAAPTTPTPPAQKPAICNDPNTAAGSETCAKCNRAQAQLQQIQTQETTTAAAAAVKEGIMREFPGLEDIFRYVEVFPELMLANIRCDANGDKSNAFGSSPGTLSLTADLRMPGVNGMRIGELFWVDRIPAFYKAFGAFQIMSIEDTIDINGWQTGIHAQFNYLGTKWKEAIVALLDRDMVRD